MPKKKAIKPEVSEEYKLTLKSLGRVYHTEGATLAEALGKIKIGNGANALAVLKVQKGDRIRDNVFIKAMYTQGLFSDVGPTRRGMALKHITALVGL